MSFFMNTQMRNTTRLSIPVHKLDLPYIIVSHVNLVVKVYYYTFRYRNMMIIEEAPQIGLRKDTQYSKVHLEKGHLAM
jgi:hypothetical protein